LGSILPGLPPPHEAVQEPLPHLLPPPPQTSLRHFPELHRWPWLTDKLLGASPVYRRERTTPKSQVGSAFALTYSLRLRSCRLMGAFVISPLPPFLIKTACAARPLDSASITPLLRYYGPGRHRLAFGRFPGFAGYTAYLAPPISRWGEDGFSSCSTCPCHRAVPTTPPK